MQEKLRFANQPAIFKVVEPASQGLRLAYTFRPNNGTAHFPQLETYPRFIVIYPAFEKAFSEPPTSTSNLSDLGNYDIVGCITQDLQSEFKKGLPLGLVYITETAEEHNEIEQKAKQYFYDKNAENKRLKQTGSNVVYIA